MTVEQQTTVFASERDTLARLERFDLQATDAATVRPGPDLDAIAEVFPDFVGCVNAVFRKPNGQP